jgi:hypothetical protein
MLPLVFFSIDSFVAMAALGTLGLDVSRRRVLCLAFALCDGLATFAGLHFHPAPIAAGANEPWFYAGPMCLWGVVVALVACRARASGALSVWQLTLLPILLSFDNLFAGSLTPQVAAHVAPASTLLGLLSGVLAFVGFQTGAQLFSRFHPRLALSLGGTVLFLLPILS